jgi:hypothetical protein
LFISFKNKRKVFSVANHCFEVEKEPLKSQSSKDKCDFWKQEGATKNSSFQWKMQLLETRKSQRKCRSGFGHRLFKSLKDKRKYTRHKGRMTIFMGDWHTYMTLSPVME